MRVCLSARLACFSTACAALMCDSSRAALQQQSTAPQHTITQVLPRIGPSPDSCISSNANRPHAGSNELPEVASTCQSPLGVGMA